MRLSPGRRAPGGAGLRRRRQACRPLSLGASDSVGSIYQPRGLNIDRLIGLKEEGKSVDDYGDGQKGDRDAVIGMDCDIWIPAARPDVIHTDNVGQLKAKLVVQGANIPITHEAERLLHERGVLCVPDFIANAGGVICAAMEYKGACENTAMAAIEEKLRHNTRRVLDAVKQQGILPRQAAVELAQQRIKRAVSFRRWSVF
ncbi:MAG: hypothetical protein P8X63_12495 [Desulfuromonadaceae bacterium]